MHSILATIKNFFNSINTYYAGEKEFFFNLYNCSNLKENENIILAKLRLKNSIQSNEDKRVTP